MISVRNSQWPYRHRIPKDPDAVLDYEVNWSGWLADGESIAAVWWTVTGGLTVVAESRTTTSAKVWLGGGSVGSASFTCRITTDAAPVARTDDRTIILTIAHR